MKNFTRILISAAVIALSACSVNNSFAQSSASSQTSATIVTPFSMEKLTDLQFENVPVIRKTTHHIRISGKSNSKQAVVPAAEVTAASFTVSGYPNYAYGVTLPASVTMAVGTRTVTIGTTLSAASANYTLSARGTDALSIAGTISVSTTDALAMNTNTDTEGFPVTVIYN